jgi:hypothetical protein
MDDGGHGHAVTAGRLGRIGLLAVAGVTAWGAITAAGGGHGLGAQLVAAPVVAATNPHPASTRSTAAARPGSPQRVSRDEVRVPVRVPGRPRAGARTLVRSHVAR